MPTRAAWMTLVVTTFTLIGCGSLCDRFDGVGKSLDDKRKACNFSVGQTYSSKYVKLRCENATKTGGPCTADDQRKLGLQLDCLDRVPTCELGKEQAFTDAITKCATENVPNNTCVSGL
jgi:hypothetical protein